MNIEVIRLSGDLKREVWRFSFFADYARSGIYFNYYSFQTKETTRHKNWLQQTHWARLDRRGNNIDKPPFPGDVEKELRQKIADNIKEVPIIY